MLISIEGNIGSGKSTLVEYLKSLGTYIFVDEPVSEWLSIKDKDGSNALECFYKDQKENAFSDILYGIMATDSDLKNRMKEVSLKFSGNKVTIQVKNREDFKAKLETALFNAKTVAFKSVAHKSTVEVTQVDISNYQQNVIPYLNLGTSNVVFEYKD